MTADYCISEAHRVQLNTARLISGGPTQSQFSSVWEQSTQRLSFCKLEVSTITIPTHPNAGASGHPAGDWSSRKCQSARPAARMLPTSDEAAEPWIVTSGLAPEVAQVREALDKFSRNFELKGVDRLKSESWPSMSPKACKQLKNTFATLSQITLQEDCAGAPFIVVDSADWACSEEFGYQIEGQPRYNQTHALGFHLKKVEGQWYVEGRRLLEK